MVNQKVPYEDEIERSVSRIIVRRRYLNPEQLSNPKSGQKYIAGNAEKSRTMSLQHIIGWICIVISGLAWIFYLGGAPWAPLIWLRFVPMAILVILVSGHYFTVKKRKKERE